MILVRKKHCSVTYYIIRLYPTLFDDFLLIHHGGLQDSRASKKHYFSTKKEALIGSLNLVSAKKAEGFELLNA